MLGGIGLVQTQENTADTGGSIFDFFDDLDEQEQPEFINLARSVIQCASDWDFSCAETKLEDMSILANNPGDYELINILNQYINYQNKLQIVSMCIEKEDVNCADDAIKSAENIASSLAYAIESLQTVDIKLIDLLNYEKNRQYVRMEKLRVLIDETKDRITERKRREREAKKRRLIKQYLDKLIIKYYIKEYLDYGQSPFFHREGSITMYEVQIHGIYKRGLWSRISIVTEGPQAGINAIFQETTSKVIVGKSISKSTIDYYASSSDRLLICQWKTYTDFSGKKKSYSKLYCDNKLILKCQYYYPMSCTPSSPVYPNFKESMINQYSNEKLPYVSYPHAVLIRYYIEQNFDYVFDDILK